ncbi:hypothetical protein [Nitrobacter sp.]|uniref:hypothetical protein n=1 Tax=Nitrobacter sp. TaxID=29420 RepID=UPI001D5D9946|nr:hypothetical protein [Nitrobacter sp.]MCB1393247.1 hypothetical protein [Nitrobacter sp.]
MAISYPLDILADFPGWTTEFDLGWRQERSRTAGGRTIVKDLGNPIWRLAAQSRPLSANEMDYWRARLQALENGLQTFYGRSMSRCYPILYPNGSWPTGGSFDGTATLATINDNRKAITVSDLPSGFQFSVGDYLAIGNDLHQVVEAATASSGTTPEFEVRPHIWLGVEAGGSPATAITVLKPSCLMSIVPDSVSSTADPQTGRGAVSFRAEEVRS